MTVFLTSFFKFSTPIHLLKILPHVKYKVNMLIPLSVKLLLTRPDRRMDGLDSFNLQIPNQNFPRYIAALDHSFDMLQF